MRISDLPFAWKLYCLALVLFATAMLLPVAGHACAGWRMAGGLIFMGVVASPGLISADGSSILFGVLFLLAAAAGLGNVVFLLAPLAMWRRASPRVFRWLTFFALLGLLLMSGIALVLLVMTEIRLAYLAWLVAYIPLIMCLGQYSSLLTTDGAAAQEAAAGDRE